MTSRAESLLGSMPRSAKVIEIGPSYNPVAPRSEGWNSRSVDHATQDELVAKYKNEPTVDVSRIEEVSYVWKSGSIADAVPKNEHGTFDAFVASHVIEHTPDLVGFFEAAQVLLKPSGIIALAVPDKRYCFDYFQSLTLTGDVIDAHLSHRSRHTLGTVFNQLAYSVAAGPTVAWGQHPVTSLRLVHEFTQAQSVLRDAKNWGETYIDAHNWRFTPASFRLVLLELAWLGLTDWKAERVTGASGCEFIAQLRRGGVEWARLLSAETFQALRLSLMKTSLIEQRAQIDWFLAGEPHLGLAPNY